MLDSAEHEIFSGNKYEMPGKKKKVREKSREFRNHKPQPFPDIFGIFIFISREMFMLTFV